MKYSCLTALFIKYLFYLYDDGHLTEQNLIWKVWSFTYKHDGRSSRWKFQGFLRHV